MSVTTEIKRLTNGTLNALCAVGRHQRQHHQLSPYLNNTPLNLTLTQPLTLTQTVCGFSSSVPIFFRSRSGDVSSSKHLLVFVNGSLYALLRFPDELVWSVSQFIIYHPMLKRIVKRYDYTLLKTNS